MNGFSQLDTLDELQAQLERVRLEFIITEIETAWAFARSGKTLYGAGSANADRVSGKAWEAYSGAVSQLRMLAIDRKQRKELTAKLDQIRLLLDGLPFARNKRKSTRKNGKVRKSTSP